MGFQENQIKELLTLMNKALQAKNMHKNKGNAGLGTPPGASGRQSVGTGPRAGPAAGVPGAAFSAFTPRPPVGKRRTYLKVPVA